MGKKIGYARVSTIRQKNEGNSLDVQKEAILIKYPDAKVVEEAYTATKKGVREKFDAVIEELKQEPDSTLIVYKLDRMARTVREGLETIETLLDCDVTVDILNLGKFEKNSPISKLLLTVMLAIAEFEASQIIERCMEGKEHAKKNNSSYREGRPKKYTEAQIQHALNLLSENSYSKTSALTGISVSTLVRAKRKFVA